VDMYRLEREKKQEGNSYELYGCWIAPPLAVSGTISIIYFSLHRHCPTKEQL
jgi:hypothetical protein